MIEPKHMMMPVGVVILAGGESSRMGSPKALLPLTHDETHDETLLDFHIRHAQRLNLPIMVADNGKNFCQSNTITIIDDHLNHDKHGKGAGALSAIAGAMKHCSEDGFLLVLSCDSLLGADIVFEQLTHGNHADVIYLKGDKEYPLLAMYHTNLLAKLTQFLDKGNRSVMAFLSQINSHAISIPHQWQSLTNFNTIQEFHTALHHLKNGIKKENPMTENKQFTHLTADGDIAMVDVSNKTATHRTATATGQVIFPADIYQAIKSTDGMTKKGSIIQTAHIAGVMAAKHTHELIPLCHQLPLDSVKLSFEYDDKHHAINITATAKVTHKTGVEMEALTAVSVACLTIYDMTKAMSHDIIITDVCLLNKTGGKSDYVK